jgi:hypothetical protein
VGPQVARVQREIERRVAAFLADAAGGIWDDLVDGTPVDSPEYTDTPGVTRGNWNYSIGVEDDTFSESRQNPMGPPPPVPAPAAGDRVFMINAAPWAAVLEYGTYPVPVKVGSYNRLTQSYVKKTEGTPGFSPQAPSGWVRTIAASAQARLNAAVARVRSGG